MASLWTMEQLRNLRELHAEVFGSNGEGRIHVIPVSRGHRREQYGARITWEARLFRRGVIGPLAVTQENLEGMGVPAKEASDWAEKTERAVRILNKLYPTFEPGIEQKVKAIESSVKGALPSGGREVTTHEGKDS